MITLTKLRPYTGDITAPSPNHSARNGKAIEGIVLHATADGGNEDGTLNWLRSPKSRASCHLFVGRDGRVVRLVGDRECAWHAGGTRWRGKPDVNAATLGIEIANRNDGEPYSDAQYVRVAAIVAHYCRQGLPLKAVIGHGEIHGRAGDPFGWDWDRFRTMVRQLLRVDDFEDGHSVYDRRSAERRAIDQAASHGDASHGDAPPDATPNQRATPADGVWVSAPPTEERRSTPRSTRRVPTPATSSTQRAHAPRRPKPVLRSRTLWLNGVTALAAGTVLMGDALDLAFSVGLNVPKELTKWILFGIGILNIILRLRTSQPVACSQRSEPSLEEGGTIRMTTRTPPRDLGTVAAMSR